jgi:hypothetical protein
VKQHFGNATPFGVEYDPTTGCSVIYDRLWRGLVRIRGRFPRCAWETATTCDLTEQQLFGIANPTLIYRADNNVHRCDAAVRGRLAELFRKCPQLYRECERRSMASVAAPSREKVADLIEATFGEPLSEAAE